jgi:hypothetical protein
MGSGRQHRLGGRRGFLILALLALWVQVLIPSGFMVASSDTGPALVICTGHGALTLDSHGQPGKAPSPKADMPCVFAGHGVAGATPPVARVSPPTAIVVARVAQAIRRAAPGRGLAAPPPPSHGPPPALT